MFLSKFLFLATAAVTTIFVITILAMMTTVLGDPESVANQWFNRNGAMVLTVQVIAIGLVGMAAMIVDRRETLQEARRGQNRIKPDSPPNRETKTPSTT